jgi:hypothetical protein
MAAMLKDRPFRARGSSLTWTLGGQQPASVPILCTAGIT